MSANEEDNLENLNGEDGDNDTDSRGEWGFVVGYFEVKEVVTKED